MKAYKYYVLILFLAGKSLYHALTTYYTSMISSDSVVFSIRPSTRTDTAGLMSVLDPHTMICSQLNWAMVYQPESV